MAHSTELRGRVITDLALGLSLRQVARKQQVTHTTVRRWRDEAVAAGQLPRVGHGTFQEPGSKRSARDGDLGDWITIYVHAVFDAIIAEVTLLGDPEWLRQQPAEFVLRAHTELSDRAARMVANARPAPLAPDRDDRASGSAPNQV